MNKRVWAGVLIASFALGTRAQSTAAGEKAFRDAVLKKQLMMRGFSADRKVLWHWDGRSLVEDAPQFHTLGVLTATSVKVKGNRIEIEGERQTLAQKPDSQLGLFAAKTKVSVEVDLNGADMGQVLPQLPNLLFYPSPKSALLDTKHQPASVDLKQFPPKDPDVKPCDCSNLDLKICGTEKRLMGMIGMKSPSVTSRAEPEYSNEARSAKLNGIVQTSLIVDATGKTTDIWITRPVGLGLDENAAKSISRYKFMPATCHDQPVPFDLYIDVNFEIF